jgi:hypothetical protein
MRTAGQSLVIFLPMYRYTSRIPSSKRTITPLRTFLWADMGVGKSIREYGNRARRIDAQLLQFGAAAWPQAKQEQVGGDRSWHSACTTIALRCVACGAPDRTERDDTLSEEDLGLVCSVLFCPPDVCLAGWRATWAAVQHATGLVGPDRCDGGDGSASRVTRYQAGRHLVGQAGQASHGRR